MISFKQFINESINDKGILKAIFVVGLPGSGKSYTVSRLKGAVSPVVVNTDKAAEFLSRKFKKDITSSTWADFKDTTQRITKQQLAHYVNGMLPLFVDGTSNDVSNILQRIGMLESLGYDVGVVFVSSDLDTAIRRANERAEKIGRHVDEDFIRYVHAQNEENRAYLKNKVAFFRDIDNNNDGILDDSDFDKAFKLTQSFFASPVENPVGKRILEKLKEEKQKYIVPAIYPMEVLEKKIDGWYKS